MSHYKRHRPRRKVRCTICTPGRIGNSLDGRAPRRVRIARQWSREDINEAMA